MKAKVKKRLIGHTSVAWMPVRVCESPNLLFAKKCAGTFDYDNESGEIVISSQLKGNERTDTLIHELIHAADEAYCLNLSEQKTRLIAHGVTQGLKMLVKV
jgi:hypothetical protein